LQGIPPGNAKISAGISQTGDFAMARRRDWEHMTDKQKFDFLYGWCLKLEATLAGRRKVIYRINAELKKVQKKLEGEIWVWPGLCDLVPIDLTLIALVEPEGDARIVQVALENAQRMAADLNKKWCADCERLISLSAW
jgi:hypothetical protein